MPRTRRAISCRRSAGSCATCRRRATGLRVDTGVFEGAEISLYYDPMIAKLVAYGADRDAAIDRLRDALDGFYIAGVRHNIAFLAAIAASDAVSRRRAVDRFHRRGISRRVRAARRVCRGRPGRSSSPRRWPRPALHERETAIDGRPPGPAAPPTASDRAARRPAAIRSSVRPRGRRLSRSRPSGERCLAATDWRPGQPLLHLRLDDRTRDRADRAAAGRGVPAGAWRGDPPRPGAVAARRRTAAADAGEAAADTSRLVLSPMPGLLTAIVVAEGQEVKAGEPLVVVEAMKMENVLRAERDGRIAKLRAKPGDSLAVDQVILEFE